MIKFIISELILSVKHFMYFGVENLYTTNVTCNFFRAMFWMYLKKKFLFILKTSKWRRMQKVYIFTMQLCSSWQPDSNFPYDRLRFPPKLDPKTEFLENQEVEVYSRSSTQEANGWWKCRIKVSFFTNWTMDKLIVCVCVHVRINCE